MTTRKVLALLLALALCLGMAACGEKEEPTNAPSTEAENTQAAQSTEAQQPAADCSAAGEYFLDGTPLGMPMQWYLKIEKDGQFQISTSREYAADKGHGQVAENNGTFVLVYSDSTTEAPKNATFTMKDGNLYFTTNIPIGSASMDGSEENPFVAYCYANEDLLGEYVTSYVSEGMMGTVVYDISLLLQTGRRYEYSSVFTMGGSEYTYAEIGSFAIDGSALSLTAAKRVSAATLETGELMDVYGANVLTGTISAEKIEIGLLTSPMKSDTVDLTLTPATTAEAAGKYFGYKSSEMFTIESVLKLGKSGTYTYTSDFSSPMMGSSAYKEEGTFTFTETAVTLTPVKSSTDGAELAPVENPAAYEVTRTGLILTGKMPTGGMSSELTLCKSLVNGTFTADNSDTAAEGDPIYQLTMELKGNATFTLKVMNDFTLLYETEGTFEATDSMVTFSYDGGACKFVGMLADGSFNARNVPLNAEGSEDSFEFKKTAPAEAAGSYTGSYTSESAMGTTVYTLALELKEDGTYDYSAEFTMGGTTYKSLESGLYLANGSELKFKALKATTNATIETGELLDIAEENQEVLTGTLTDGSIAVTRKVSCMARSAVDLSFAPAAPQGM